MIIDTDDIKIEQLHFDDARWTDFILKFSDVNIFHSPEMNKVFSISKGFTASPLFALHKSKILGCVFPILVHTDFILPNRLKDRLVLFSSPLFSKSTLGLAGLKLLLTEVQAMAKKKALFSEIRNSESFMEEDNDNVMKSWEYMPRENYFIDFTLGEKELSARLSSGTRRNIRRGMKHGCVIEEISSPDGLKCVIGLIEELYERKKIPMVDTSVFYNAFDLLLLKGFLRIIAMKKNDEIIGVRLSLNYADTVYDWYAASKTTEKKEYPNEALVWNTIQWGINNNYKRFDFGGGGVPGKHYGPAVFKEKFKGNKVEFGRNRYSNKKILLTIMENLYEWQLKISSKSN